MAGCPRALCPQLCPSHPGLGSLSAGEPGPEQPHRVGWGESRGREWTVGQHSKKGRGRRGWWLLPTGTGHGWAVAAVRKTPTLRQQEPPGVNMQTTHKICKHHRELGPRCLALGIRVKAQSSRGRRSLSWAESSLAGLGSPVYRDRITDRLWGPSADRYPRLLCTGHSCIREDTCECASVCTTHFPTALQPALLAHRPGSVSCSAVEENETSSERVRDQ